MTVAVKSLLWDAMRNRVSAPWGDQLGSARARTPSPRSDPDRRRRRRRHPAVGGSRFDRRQANRSMCAFTSGASAGEDGGKSYSNAGRGEQGGEEHQHRYLLIERT